MEFNLKSTKNQLRKQQGTRIKLSGLALIVIATVIIGIALACGAPISPWWLVAPIASPFAIVLAVIAMALAAVLIVMAACIVGVLVAIALGLICIIPILLLVALYSVKTKLLD